MNMEIAMAGVMLNGLSQTRQFWLLFCGLFPDMDALTRQNKGLVLAW